MTPVAPTAPKHGRRGDLAPLSLGDRDRRFREEHDASTRQRAETPPNTWAACKAWFVGEWQASLPARMHTSGVEADSALGSPRMAPALASRIGNASERGWGVTGHDRDGQPRGMTKDGEHTRDWFLFYLERMLNSGGVERIGAQALVRWAYLGMDDAAAAHPRFVQAIGAGADPDAWSEYLSGQTALLERTIRSLWHRCQSEPIRWSVCRQCRQRACVCGERSEAQVNAEDAA